MEGAHLVLSSLAERPLASILSALQSQAPSRGAGSRG